MTQILTLVYAPNETLVEKIDDELKKIIDRMIKTMYFEHAVVAWRQYDRHFKTYYSC